jgi:extracellular factor (EF) 3-hydroxypalmitic acid methyl ester biosynthesis protein
VPEAGRLNNHFVLAREMIHAAYAMSAARNGNGNGHGKHSLIRQLEKKAARTQTPASPNAIKESRVTFQTAEGVELNGTLARVTRHAVCFDLYSPSAPPRFSEVFEGFQIILQEQIVYSGRATIRNVLDVGTRVVCEATLRESDWTDLNSGTVWQRDGEIAREFKAFLNDWQKLCKVTPEFKLVIADMQSFLHHLQLWLGRVELKIKALPSNEQEKAERKIIRDVAGEVIPFVDALFEKFENIVRNVAEEQRPAYGSYTREHLHPLVLNADFARRTYEKPLGYPGDYEMVNMILRDGYEGNSLFAKVVHGWFVKQPPAAAHRNRIKYLTDRIGLEAHRLARSGGTAKIYNFACGPAVEVQDFFRSAYSEKVELTLADFNGETIEHTGRMLETIKRLLQLRTTLHFQKKTVHQLIKDRQRNIQSEKSKYDFVYCAGLFDYLPDSTCKQLMNIFYGFLAPGGLLVVTNVESSNPLRYGMEYLLDWHLIYRTEEDMQKLRPDGASGDDVRVFGDETGVNLFMEVRKPANG